jgi:hypothetical protein
MMGASMIRSSMLAVVAIVCLGGTVAAQSITSVRGPGYPLMPTDARSMVLGGLGIGLHGFSAPLTNPASVAHSFRRGGVVTLESVDRSIQLGDESDDVGTTRFPLIRVIFPVRGAVLTAGYGGYLDQSYSLGREGELVLDDRTVGYRDVTRSEGGVGEFQVGAALPLGQRLGVGAVVGLHTGNQRVEQSRVFDLEEGLESYRATMRWRYSGPMAQVGVQWEPMEIVRLGASVRWAGTLVGKGVQGRAERREVDLPLQVAAGASGFLVPGLLATVSGRWSGWSVTDPHAVGAPSESASARDTWEIGGGFEWAPIRPAARRSFPLRVGAQYRQLPFPFAEEPPSEWFAGVGAGMRVGPDPRHPLALVDLAVQRGTRTATGTGTVGDLRERMWRMVLSVSLFGN